MSKYIHNQTTLSTVWTVSHNLGSKPIFDILVNESGNLVKVFPQYVEYITNNTLEITFSSARTGKVILITDYSN